MIGTTCASILVGLLLVKGCFGALYQTHIVAPRTPSSCGVIRDKLRMSSPGEFSGSTVSSILLRCIGAVDRIAQYHVEEVLADRAVVDGVQAPVLVCLHCRADPRDPLLRSERTQGFTAGPVYGRARCSPMLGSLKT